MHAQRSYPVRKKLVQQLVVNFKTIDKYCSIHNNKYSKEIVMQQWIHCLHKQYIWLHSGMVLMKKVLKMLLYQFHGIKTRIEIIAISFVFKCKTGIALFKVLYQSSIPSGVFITDKMHGSFFNISPIYLWKFTPFWVQINSVRSSPEGYPVKVKMVPSKYDNSIANINDYDMMSDISGIKLATINDTSSSVP